MHSNSDRKQLENSNIKAVPLLRKRAKEPECCPNIALYPFEAAASIYRSSEENVSNDPTEKMPCHSNLEKTATTYGYLV